MSSVSVPLSVIIQILRPSGEYHPSVFEYIDYVASLLASGEQVPATRQAERPVGRPLKAQHPAYSDADLKAIKAYLMEEIAAHPNEWKNAGRLPKGLAQEQPDDATEIRMDNGLTAIFAEAVSVVNGKAAPLFPPSVTAEQ